ncbi:molecular chaperone HtpG [Beggiatoa leptomitoformis]|uniref:Chaperone protein HtpG n=1 Tax=Beggiatoa leptomitoformis TaxID=288004 RepID=A0A2N9YD24_9GAMM|nr:molecular chaperone HtpG [Beggiatoa leptomitoformis]ALG69189.1 molecular chaperone HtpG [Beggiatoa leptomitoformis]AUI68383.1 molecular chaperone HtpG [Beggiatoa leptomitoformis]
MVVDNHKETLGFQAEVKQLLDLMIHALYSNKEIFLRELVSNASDAADKLRFEALSDDGLYEGDSQLKIWVEVNQDARTISIRDNGIGMSREEVIENIGTIAKSGTRQFFKALTGDQAKDAQLIGQFGVGFYSSFIIADKVTLTTRRAGLTAEHGVRWESAGDGEYTIETVDKAQRGTEITLHLRDDEDEFLQEYRIKSIIKKYSDHITLPIIMPTVSTDENDENLKVIKDEVVNSATALWVRNKADVTEEEYNEFYKHVAHDFEPPLLTIHNKVEGTMEYNLLAFIPGRAPFDLWDRNTRRGMKLYVRRIFIMDDSEQLLPPYLRFVRGVVDSSDLPLNVSREILQQNKQIESIRSGTVKKILGALENLANNEPEKYATFWREFGKVLKEGIVDDHSNREKVAKLLRFSTTHDDNNQPAISLEQYIGRMKEGQEKIYYITAETFAAAKSSPHLEIFRKKGIEVVLLSEPIDEWLVMHLTEFEGKSLQSITKGSLDLGQLEDQAEKDQVEKANTEKKPLLERIQKVLVGKVKEVRTTYRLTNSPACLVADEQGMDASLERLLKAAGQSISSSKPIIEINPTHPLILAMEREQDENRFGDWALILFDQALLSEGGQLEDPASFISRLNQMLIQLSKAA